MSQKYNENIKRSKPQDTQLKIFKISAFCWKIQHYMYLSLRIHPQTLVQRRMQLKHISHVVKVCVKATCLHFNPWCKLKETTEPAGPFGTMPHEIWHPGRVLTHTYVPTLPFWTGDSCFERFVLCPPVWSRNLPFWGKHVQIFNFL